MSETTVDEVERLACDVLIIGAGGAGLRAAVEARLAGKSVIVVSKSLFGKAHTVMAEGGAAAAMGNVNPGDGWKVHFRDTMRGGKFLNNYRMAELHAQEAPDRIWELETYGALFDRTAEGKISQRNFGGHEYPRLAHVGDRTGLELIRTLQQKLVSMQQEDKAESGRYESMLKVIDETTMTELILEDGAVKGAFGYRRDTGAFLAVEAPSVVLATGGIGRSFKVTSNSWEYTGDGHALALKAGASLINMEFIQFHPTGMVWPASVRGILVTESVRGDGGVLKNSEGRRFMFEYIPEVFKAQYADTPEEADRWYSDPDNNRRPPELLPRDEVARAINSEVKAGRGTENGGVYLDIASRRSAEFIMKKLPSMYHQFKELADVDITAEPMEVGPTCHYIMGGVEVDAETTASKVDGLFAAGEVSGGMHGSNRLGGNSLSDLLVFGKRAGEFAAGHASRAGAVKVTDGEIESAMAAALRPFDNDGENPYQLQAALQAVNGRLVGIIRRAAELEEALGDLEELRPRIDNVTAIGGRAYNPGWHLALDLHNMWLCSVATARAALERDESRGGHTREDAPGMDPQWRKLNLVEALEDGEVRLRRRPVPAMPEELLGLFEPGELGKYMTPDEYRSEAETASGEEGKEEAE
ncbi:fumarate reductase/succinate dehydrogenase flavoprotein subunit [Glycomyces xiaoerkulensis]|uniref:fumarate reductase/succinate dehydrogenase flavoprotein subunit n=1 Tax=Glycomyces xiaoerkulensis TaxID=2038139 RepID=UPI000C260705|nr:fumarate reductase/succinate dehydrogenase flavoprotein subunit [Glycomyces xiaoerkulensis]